MALKKTEELNKRIQAYIRTNTPIKANGRLLTIEEMSVKEPDALNDLDKQIEMKYKGAGDLKGWIRGKITISDEKTKKIISQSGLMNIIPVYYVTERGTYIVGGKEKNILTQIRRKPGIYTSFKSGGINTDFYIDYGFFGVLLPVWCYIGKNRNKQLLYFTVGLILLSATKESVQYCSL